MVKRKRGLSFSNGRKRKKTFKRRRGTRQGYASTSTYGRPFSVPFKGRRGNVRQWRNMLMRDTQAKAHYRSIFQGVKTVTAPVLGTPGVQAVWLFPALQASNNLQAFHTAGEKFWEGGGGATDIDFGVVVPLFRGDVVLRGGMARLSIVNNDNLAARIRVYGFWAKELPDLTLYSGMNNTNRPVEFEPSVFPDFATKFGKILYNKQAVIRQGESFEMVHRFKPQKIDQVRFSGDATDPAGSQLWWMVGYAPLEPNVVPESLRLINSWNLSFSADAV